MLDQPAALVGSASDPDHPAAHDLADLADRRTDCTRRARYQQRFARLGLRGVEQAEVGGQPDRAHRRQVIGRAGHDRNVDHRSEPARRDTRIVLQRVKPHHPVAHREIGIGRGVDHTHRGRAHRAPERDRRHVAWRIVHPPALRRIERGIVVAHDEAARMGRRHRLADQAEIVGDRITVRPAYEQKSAILGHDTSLGLGPAADAANFIAAGAASLVSHTNWHIRQLRKCPCGKHLS